MRLSDFDYELPESLIASRPPEERRDSRLLVVDGDRLTDSQFAVLPEWLRAGDLLVLNDTRVVKARLRGRKATGGKIEVLIERLLEPERALAHVRASKSPSAGVRLEFEDDVFATVLGREGNLFLLEFSADASQIMASQGEVPLPPYIDRRAEEFDEQRYQTVYASEPGAVAAPTAGLHFDEPMLAELESRGVGHCFVTLHVGAGTFQTLKHENVNDNSLHSERIVVSDETARQVREARASGGRVVAVGTTSVRSLESASRNGEIDAFQGESDLFIRPGYRFRSVDALITNFHLPRSSLLMLVSALAGRERMLHAYQHAVSCRYRFFSYGDAMLIIPDGGSS